MNSNPGTIDLRPVGPARSVRLAQRNKQIGTRVSNAERGSYIASRVKSDATIASMITLGVVHSKRRGLLEEILLIHAPIIELAADTASKPRENSSVASADRRGLPEALGDPSRFVQLGTGGIRTE